MVTGAWATIAIPAGVRKVDFWGIAFLTMLGDAAIFYLYL